jgi:glycosyltransferase involved in cell wall biosynthesis
MDKLKELSVFLPAYNEETNIGPVALKILSILPEIAEDFELIIIDDGSKDKTERLAEGLSKKDSRVRCICHGENRGYGAALRSGLYESKFEWISFTDADGQFDFSEIKLFIEKQRQTNADLIIGYYLKRAVPFYRKINSLLWKILIFLLFGLRVRDIDCGFKLISKKVIESIPTLESERGAFISTELLIKAKKRGFKIVEVGVHHYPRKAGAPTGANLNVIIRSFIDLFKLWEKLR